MRMKMLAVALAMALSTGAQAKNPARGWYVGIDAGTAEMDGSVTAGAVDQFEFDETSPTVTAHAGYRFNRFLQLGAFYSDLGSFSVTRPSYRATADLRAVGVMFNLRIPLGEKFGLHSNISAMNRRLDVSLTEPGEQTVSDYHGGIVARLGIGLGYQMSPQLDFRLDFSRTSGIGDTFYVLGPPLDFDANLRTLTAGLRYKF